MEIPCINLRERFGGPYKVDLEEPAVSFADPWYHIIPCEHGHIYVHGHDYLGFASKSPIAGKRSVAARVAALPFTQVVQDGCDGANIIFDVRYFDLVATIVKPRRRRRLSDEQRAAAVDRLRPYQPPLGLNAKDAARQRAQMTRGIAPTADKDVEHHARREAVLSGLGHQSTQRGSGSVQ